MIEAAHTEPLAAQSIAAQSILGQSWPTQPVQLELAQHGGGQSLLGLAATLFLIATPVLHLAFAWVVWSDYARLAADRRWRARLFGPRWLWALATALTGLFAACLTADRHGGDGHRRGRL